MTQIRTLALIAATVMAVVFFVSAAKAADPPADLCSLLSPADVSKALARTYSAPEKTVAPRPFANTAQGTDCHYSAQGSVLWFRAYVDSSPAESKDLFARLSKFYGTPTPVPGLADEAYFDAQHAIHVRKGKVRYYLNLNPLGNAATAEKQLKDLATKVASQL